MDRSESHDDVTSVAPVTTEETTIVNDVVLFAEGGGEEGRRDALPSRERSRSIAAELIVLT